MFLSEPFLEFYRSAPVNWGFHSGPNSLGEVTYRRTYSREGEEWWETVQRVVEGTYEILENHCKHYALPFDTVLARSDAEQMYDLIFNFKFLPPGRGLWMMGTDYIRQRGGAALNNPLDEETPILTEEYGWIPIGDIEGEEVTVLTSVHDYGSGANKLSKNEMAASHTWADAKISYSEKQSCLEVTFHDKWGNETTIVASENHRWFRRLTSKKDWERVSTADLQVGDYVPIVQQPAWKKMSKAGQQHGFFFGDGTRSNGELHQFGDSLSILRELFGTTEVVDDYHEVVRHLPLAWGSLPIGEYLDDDRYLHGFLSGYFAADGHVDKAGNPVLCSARKGELQAVAEMFKRLGVRCSDVEIAIPEGAPNNFSDYRNALYRIRLTAIDLREDFFLKEMHRVRWAECLGSRRRDWAKITAITTAGTRRVLCAEVPGYEQFVIDGFILTSNCAFVSTQDLGTEFDKPFRFLMDMSMLGVGVGFDTRGAGQIIWSPTKGNTVDVQVEDSREGWIDSMADVLRWGFGTGPRPVFDYSLIRPQGAPIRGFGGVAEGPDPLILLHERLFAQVEKRRGNKVSSTDIVDICNMIGVCVVSGNVRRSAEIAFGDPDDQNFALLKDYKANPHRADWGWTSNNSLFVEVGQDYSQFTQRIIDNGEPGLAWLENMRGYGRMVESPDHRDWRVAGGNPCLEQSLEPYELCCLVETFPYHHKSIEEYNRTLKYAYIYAKAVTLLPTHWPETNAVMLRNRRIGTSMSGVAQFMAYRGERELVEWCEEGYDTVTHYDRVYSEWLCTRESIKKTSVKPSGTVSLLAGATPGCHFPTYRHYIRRIRFAEGHPDVAAFREAGYKVEPALSERSTVVVEFPIMGDEVVRTETEVSLAEKMRIAVLLQGHWADNQVSCTATFDPVKEGHLIPDLLRAYEERLKGISFLPMHPAGAYEQMPYEPISQGEYEVMVRDLKPIVWPEETVHDQDDSFCDGATCLVEF